MWFVIQRRSLACLDGRGFFCFLFLPFLVQRRKAGIFIKRRRGSVLKTHFFWCSISICVTAAGSDDFLSLPQSLYYFFFNCCVLDRDAGLPFLGSGLLTASRSIPKLWTQMSKLLFPESLGIVSVLEGQKFWGLSQHLWWHLQEMKSTLWCEVSQTCLSKWSNWDHFPNFPCANPIFRSPLERIDIFVVCAGFSPQHRTERDRGTGPTVSVSRAVVRTHMDTRLLPTWKVKREIGRVFGAEKGYWAVTSCVPGCSWAGIREVILSKGHGTVGSMPPPLLFLWSTPGVRMPSLMTQ